MAHSKFSDADLTRWKREIIPAPIIGQRIPLQREGSEFVAVCPFHPDKNPSFKIYKMDDGIWAFKCFGCGENGNVFQFVQKFDKISFPDAVTRVLAEAGVSGWQDGETQSEPETAAAEKKAVVTFPITVYAPAIEALEKSPAGQEWLSKRGITMAAARKFGLGFVQSAEKITTNSPWLRDGWILFPTFSQDRKTVTAVKYRSIVAKKGKVDGKSASGILRAPNTSTTLYNLRDVSTADDVWIAEGEPDTVVLAQAGLTAVGYPMSGYRPTEEECDVLSTAKRRFLAGDSDAVGKKAMEELQKRLRGATYFIQWPNNRKDANDVLTNECGNDLKKFKALLEDLKARATQTETEPIFRTGDEITPKLINWMWPGKIPLGKITLFAGNPDNGKSLAATSVAAICSTGRPFPESFKSNEPSDVLMLIGEDDLDDTAVPRLIAAGADMSRIHFLVAARPVRQDDREVQLDMDIPAIERALEKNPNIRLILIDPISNYLGEVNMVAEQEVRSILIPLKRAAEKHNVAVVIVMHLNKKNDLDAISRVGGAMAFIGVARCSWLFARNVKEEEPSAEGEPPPDRSMDTFSMLRIKNNLVSANKAGFSYKVAVKPLSIEGVDIEVPYIQWGEVIEGSADDALNRRQTPTEAAAARGVGRPDDKLQAAVRWLENELQDGEPHLVKILRADAKLAENISAETLDRARKAIGAEVVKIGGHWRWKINPLNETGESEGDENGTIQNSFLQIEGVE